MARRSPPTQRFEMQGRVATDFARPPFDDGDLARAAGRAIANIGNSLAKIAAEAEARKLETETTAASEEGARDAAALVGLGGSEAGAASPSQASAAPAASGKRAQAMAFFRQHGWSPVQAAGLVGNLLQESGLSTTAANPNDPGTSLGIGQWNRERKEALMAFAKAKGSDWHDFTTQLSFVQHELTTNEKQHGDRLKAASSIEAATAAAIGYERPKGWTLANPQAGHGFANRLGYARKLLGEGGRSFAMPEIRPLQLRKDGSPQSEAYNAALIKTGAYRANADLDGGLNALHDDFQDDPQGFEKQAQELKKRYLTAFAETPELLARGEAEFMLRYEPLARDIYARRDKKAEGEMQAAAGEAVVAQRSTLQKQAYMLGINGDGDAQLAALSKQAFNVIDAAMADGAITAQAAGKERSAVLGTLIEARFDGVFDALKSPAEKQAFAEKLASPEMRDELLGKVGLEDYRSLVSRYGQMARQAGDAHDAMTRIEKERFSRLIDDDIASLGATGKGVAVGGLPVDAGEVARVLGPQETQKWLEARSQAAKLFAATDGLAKLTLEQIDTRIKSLEPVAGTEGFAAAQTLQSKALTAAQAVLKQRTVDPALAADQAMPELADPELRKRPADLAQARLDAQAALGIPELARQPLTNQEARSLASRLTLYQNDPEALNQAVERLLGEVDQNFGPLADEAMAQVLRVNGVSSEASTASVELMRKLNLGSLPNVTQMRLFDRALSRDRAEQGIKGTAKPPIMAPNRGEVFRQATAKPKRTGPSAAQLEALRSDPEKFGQAFDKLYGEGAAKQWLDNGKGNAMQRRLADGSTELIYEDGWIETLHPDGTVDSRQGP